jgi:hypothetical protein
MRYRPVNWPLVSIGLMGVGIGAIGILFHLLSGAELPNSAPVASAMFAAIGATTVIVGWFYDPRG